MKKIVSLSVVGAVVVGAALVGTQFVSGAGESAESVFVSVTPCRLVDTRPNTATDATINVGPRSTKLGPNGSQTFGARDGIDSRSVCAIPATATAIATNVVAVAPSEASFMALFPSDVPNPGTSNLNYVAGQAPTPNSVIVPLSAAGRFDVFNKFGEVHVIVDVSGYYQPSSAIGATGPQGPAGAPGAPGATGSPGAPGAPGQNATNPARIITVGESGADFTLVSAALASISTSGSTSPYLIEVAPGQYTETSPLVMKDRVGIRGAGRQLTEITCNCSGAVLAFGGAITSNVSNLSVTGVAVGTGAAVAGLSIQGGSNVRADDVAIVVNAIGTSATADGVTVTGSTIELTDVSIQAAAGGTLSEAVGVRATGGADVRIETSEINVAGTATTGFAVDAFGAGNLIRINSSMVNGGNGALSVTGDGVGDPERIAVTGGSVIGSVSNDASSELVCAAVFDSAFLPRSTDCSPF